MLIEAIVGAFAFIAGVIAISRPTKDLHWAIKYTPIFLCAIGAFLGWEFFSQNVPVIADAKVSVMEVDTDRMYISIEPEVARKCDLRALDVYFVDEDTKSVVRSTGNFVTSKDYSVLSSSQQWKPVNIIEVSIDPRKYEYFYIVTHDRCAFNVHVRSEFGRTLVPQKFNSGLPASSPHV